MKYTTELIDRITKEYQEGKTPKEIASGLGPEVPERSVIAKLSSLGVYQRKSYLNKRGEPPVKKEEYINRIADLLDINIDLLDSLEKVTKSALVLIETKVSNLKTP
jgi:hypothetical protein